MEVNDVTLRGSYEELVPGGIWPICGALEKHLFTYPCHRVTSYDIIIISDYLPDCVLYGKIILCLRLD